MVAPDPPRPGPKIESAIEAGIFRGTSNRPKQRQDHEQVDEIIGRQDACGDDRAVALAAATQDSRGPTTDATNTQKNTL